MKDMEPGFTLVARRFSGVNAVDSVLSPGEILNRERDRHSGEATRKDRTDKQRASHARLASDMSVVIAYVVELEQERDRLRAENAQLRNRADGDPSAGEGESGDGEGEGDSDDFQARPYALAPEDLDGLPPEVLAELNITPADKFETFIVSKIREAGGVLSLDKLIVACYRERGEVHKRTLLNARLYRMTRKRLIWSVPRRKAIYTTDPDIGKGTKPVDG